MHLIYQIFSDSRNQWSVGPTLLAEIRLQKVGLVFRFSLRPLKVICSQSIVYPWSSLPTSDTITICDVGGGNGHVVLELLKSLPDHQLKAVIQDMASMLDEGRTLWSEQFPEAVKCGRVDFIPIDFFKQSPVEGCDFYYVCLSWSFLHTKNWTAFRFSYGTACKIPIIDILYSICILYSRLVRHNWSDDKCVLLLSNIAAAMRASASKNSRLLIRKSVDFDLQFVWPLSNVDDLIIQYATSSSPMAPPGLEYAPPPLLSNYGAGRMRAYDLDINMLHLLGEAKERTIEEFVELGYVLLH